MGMRKAAPLDRFRFRKLLEMLEKKEGRGTELISVYIPPGKRVSEVMNDLRSEWGTASNIKSKTTRKNVQDALTKVMERLKLFKESHLRRNNSRRPARRGPHGDLCGHTPRADNNLLLSM